MAKLVEGRPETINEWMASAPDAGSRSEQGAIVRPDSQQSNVLLHDLWSSLGKSAYTLSYDVRFGFTFFNLCYQSIGVFIVVSLNKLLN